MEAVVGFCCSLNFACPLVISLVCHTSGKGLPPPD